jgi:hypothetical protein
MFSDGKIMKFPGPKDLQCEVPVFLHFLCPKSLRSCQPKDLHQATMLCPQARPVSFEVQGKMTKGNIWIFWTKNTNPQPSVNQDGHGKSISRKPSVDDFSSFSCGWDVPISRRPHLPIVGGMDCCVEGDHVGSHAQRIGIEEEGLLRKFH